MADYDSELMLRASGGETDAYRELFDRNYARAVNVAYRYLGDKDLAEDVAMDAFAKVYESRRKFRGDAKFTTYLHRILVNLSINASRRASRTSPQDIDELDLASPAETDPAEAAQRAEVARAVKKAVLALPDRQRVALILTRYESMSYQNAAESMGVSIKALESLLHRAKHGIRQALREYMGAE